MNFATPCKLFANRDFGQLLQKSAHRGFWAQIAPKIAKSDFLLTLAKIFANAFSHTCEKSPKKAIFAHLCKSLYFRPFTKTFANFRFFAKIFANYSNFAD